MSNYTPTTQNVRDCVIFDFDMSEEETVARFDRWLAEVKAQVWEEGYTHGLTDMASSMTPNPYRQEEEQ